MRPALAAELKRLCLGIAGGALLGWLVGSLASGLALGVATLLAWHLLQLWRVERWLDGQAPLPVRRAGLWREVSAKLERLLSQNRKRKKRLRKVARRFIQAAEANPDGALILHDHDQIEWLNPAASRMLGLRPVQDHGQRLSNLVRNPGFVQYLARRDFAEPFELDSPVTDGQRLLLRVVPYGNNRSMMLVRDITRLHTLEQMRKDFVANVSHELRSPLTVLIGYLEAIDDDEALPDSFRRPVAQMSQQASRMGVIVEDLLRLSRIESDPSAAPHRAISMREMLHRIRDDALRLGSVRHRIEVDVEPGLALLGDYNQLYSAFSNLVFNAVQYTPDDGRIAVRWRGDGDGASLDVEDTGVGVEPHHIPRLTERFYRVDKARSRALGGTGLGLAIVKHVLMRHEARLEVRSEPGAGSTFSCKFTHNRIKREVQAASAQTVASG